MVAFITGATRGIGLELTKILLQKEYDVIATGRNTKGSKELTSLRSDYPENLKLIDLDVTHDHKISNLPGELTDFSHIDLLINNAGMFTADDNAPLEHIDPTSALTTFIVNTMGPLKVTKTLLPKLSKSKNPVVVSITSQMGSIDDNKMGRYYGYRMSKAALNMMTKSLSIDYPEMISIVIHPGWVRTEMGGEQAPVLPHESAMGIVNVIQKLQKEDSGKFYNFKGQTLPW